MNKKTYYITGGTCDIGREIVRALIKKNKKVILLARDIIKAKSIFKNSKIVYHYFDLQKKLNNLEVSTNSILIHCAWENSRDVYHKSHMQNIIKYHYRFIDKMVSLGVKKVIITGTCSEFGITYGPVKFNDDTNPCTPYSVSKDYLHKSLRLLENNKNFELIWLRLFYIYGESIDKKTVVSLFCKAIKNCDNVFPMSFGNQRFDYLPVNEVANKIIKSINKESGVYHICSGKPIKLRKLLEKIKIEKKSNIKLNLGKYPYREHEPLAIWGFNNDIQ